MTKPQLVRGKTAWPVSASGCVMRHCCANSCSSMCISLLWRQAAWRLSLTRRGRVALLMMRRLVLPSLWSGTDAVPQACHEIWCSWCKQAPCSQVLSALRKCFPKPLDSLHEVYLGSLSCTCDNAVMELNKQAGSLILMLVANSKIELEL